LFFFEGKRKQSSTSPVKGSGEKTTLVDAETKKHEWAFLIDDEGKDSRRVGEKTKEGRFSWGKRGGVWCEGITSRKRGGRG